MHDIWIASDHHLNHVKIITFQGSDGQLLRPFSSVEEMNEVIIERHNAVVKRSDKVYFLGDFSLGDIQGINIAKRFNGQKRLVLGNHDLNGPMAMMAYLEHFDKICSSHHFEKGFVMSHIPLHPLSLSRWNVNVHGHTHDKNVILPDGTNDVRYFNVCMEATNYTPINVETIRDLHK